MYSMKTLPPLTKGEFVGFLIIIINSVRLENLNNGLNNILIGIKWWGDNEYYIQRPEHTSEEKDDSFKFEYAIRTKLNLFQSYLRHIYKQEIIIMLNSFDNIVGSAYLLDCCKVLFENSQLEIPIINFMGDKIGEMKVNIKTLHSGNGLFTERKLKSFCGTNLKSIDCRKLETDDLVSKSDVDITLHEEFRGIDKTTSLNTTKFLIPEKNSSYSSFKARQMNSSKMVPLQMQSVSIANTSPKPSKTLPRVKNVVKEMINNESPRSFPGVSKQITKLHDSLLNKSLKSSYDLESGDEKILDYLFGKQMSKLDEEVALERFKKMTPSQDLVNVVKELYEDVESASDLESGSHQEFRFSTKNQVELLDKCEDLNYDLSNPVEKLYYETFFKSSERTKPDYKLAELLNSRNLKNSTSRKVNYC